MGRRRVKKTCEEAGLRNVKTVLCTPDSVQLPPRSIDLAFLCDTYHHFEFPQKTIKLGIDWSKFRPQDEATVST